jgi:hypothetical protein
MVGIAVAAALLASACSSNQPVTALGTADAPAKQACAAFRDLQRQRAAGAMAVPALRAKLAEGLPGRVDLEHADPPGPRGGAADATTLATGGEPGSLVQDLAAMDQACASI